MLTFGHSFSTIITHLLADRSYFGDLTCDGPNCSDLEDFQCLSGAKEPESWHLEELHRLRPHFDPQHCLEMVRVLSEHHFKFLFQHPQAWTSSLGVLPLERSPSTFTNELLTRHGLRSEFQQCLHFWGLKRCGDVRVEKELWWVWVWV